MTAAHETPGVKTHLSLNVSDVEESVAFYEAFFGMPAHKRRPGYANFDLSTPALKLALNETSPTAGVGSLNHLGLQMSTAEQVQATRVRLEESGLVTFDQRNTTCCYARQDKVWAQDPDGNRWEVYVLLDDVQSEDPEEGHPEEEVEVCCPKPSASSEAAPACGGNGGCCK